MYAKITSRCIIWNAQFKLRIAMWFGIHTTKIPSIESSFELRISNYGSRCDFGVHAVQTTVFRILIQNAHFEFKFKIMHFAVVWKQSLKMISNEVWSCFWCLKWECCTFQKTYANSLIHQYTMALKRRQFSSNVDKVNLFCIYVFIVWILIKLTWLWCQDILECYVKRVLYSHTSLVTPK